MVKPESERANTVSLLFPLEIEEDWPPVSVESLPFERTAVGFKALVAPLFVKNLSVGDEIVATIGLEGRVESWSHVARSNRTTVWLLRTGPTTRIETALAQLRKLGCNTIGLEDAGCYSVDVPDSVPLADIDAILAQVEGKNVAIAFPSLRHRD